MHLSRWTDLLLRDNRQRSGPATDIQNNIARLDSRESDELFTKGPLAPQHENPRHDVVASSPVQNASRRTWCRAPIAGVAHEPPLRVRWCRRWDRVVW